MFKYEFYHMWNILWGQQLNSYGQKINSYGKKCCTRWRLYTAYFIWFKLFPWFGISLQCPKHILQVKNISWCRKYFQCIEQFMMSEFSSYFFPHAQTWFGTSARVTCNNDQGDISGRYVIMEGGGRPQSMSPLLPYQMWYARSVSLLKNSFIIWKKHFF